MSVAVQKMVQARAAGVAMTLNPANGDRSKIVIDASFGLGETVVGGDGHAGQLRRRQGHARRRQAHDLAASTIELVADLAARLRRRATRRRRAPARAVAALATRSRRSPRWPSAPSSTSACPQDVEWAVDGAAAPDGPTVVLLQSRPETVWSRRPQSGRASYQADVRHAEPGEHPDQSAGRERSRPIERRSVAAERSVRQPVRRSGAGGGAEGWEELYPYYLHFRDDRRDDEEREVLVLRLAALAAGVQAVRHDHRRVRRQVPRPVQHAPLDDPARPTGSTTASTTATAT